MTFDKVLRETYNNNNFQSQHEISDSNTNEHFLAHKIISVVMRYRRIFGRKKSCATSICEACLAPHVHQAQKAILQQQPIVFVLPAFPAKSPNPAKVLGTLPDMAEKLSLKFLHELCIEIQKIYIPGARVILCSDGRVFNDEVGIQDIDVTCYQHEIAKMISAMSLNSIEIFNLDDIYPGLSFEKKRTKLMEQYGEPIESIKTDVRNGSKKSASLSDKEANRVYCGITRFLVEDAIRPGLTKSRNAIQKECRQRAYRVIQRSRAWSELLANHFPDAVRLSIHPQTCGSSKLGIRLLEAENWMTPWHGVALRINGRYMLIKRAQAEKIGARLIRYNNVPSHYELVNKNERLS